MTLPVAQEQLLERLQSCPGHDTLGERWEEQLAESLVGVCDVDEIRRAVAEEVAAILRNLEGGLELQRNIGKLSLLLPGSIRGRSSAWSAYLRFRNNVDRWPHRIPHNGRTGFRRTRNPAATPCTSI